MKKVPKIVKIFENTVSGNTRVRLKSRFGSSFFLRGFKLKKDRKSKYFRSRYAVTRERKRIRFSPNVRRAGKHLLPYYFITSTYIQRSCWSQLIERLLNKKEFSDNANSKLAALKLTRINLPI